ncbi:class I SAM-dependent RNA methyltransferase [Propionibacteriaceae bacterium Y1685]|uniref:class I SAM-dependent RNA methyltransferase n=1 Tax=Microlunatus sp. Y1700 TaxID=3418487 RepID=UPI003B81D6FE
MINSVIGPVEVGPVAHGGHCVARHDGRVVFTRHALPGEQVMIRITDTSHERYWSGDAVEILQPAPERVEAPCRFSGPGLCGGCDFQHVELSHQRELKRRVVAEQLTRLAGFDWSGVVEEVPHPMVANGGGWRTRMQWHADESGRWGLRAHHSHRVIAVDDCHIAADGLPEISGTGQQAVTVLAAHGETALLVDGELRTHTGAVHDQLQRTITQEAHGRSYAVADDGFWQVHPAAAEILVAAVLDGLAPQAGERALDLYCGVGLFAGALHDRGVRVHGVEGGRRAVELARRNVPGARFTVGRVERTMRTLAKRADLVVLDPPRKGAGRAVMREVLARRPRAIAYVACDPAALARDLRTATDAGWQVSELRAFDLFPMTHHVECVAVLTRADAETR